MDAAVFCGWFCGVPILVTVLLVWVIDALVPKEAK
jgi:hypothetical protein